MRSIDYLIIPLWEAFGWFDEGLQSSLKLRGWQTMTRPESAVMIHVILGTNRPSDIARNLGLTRQAIHITISKMVEKGVLELHSDPLDARVSVVGLTKVGKEMRRDAKMIVQYIESVLTERIGAQRVRSLKAALAPEWGAPVIYTGHAQTKRPKKKTAAPKRKAK